MQKETLAGTGGWESFATLKKDENRYSGTASKVVIHYMLDDRNAVNSSDAASLMSGLGFGLMLAASTNSSLESVAGESDQLHPDDIISLRCRNGVAGSVTLNLNDYRIKENAVDTGEKDGYLTLWVKYPDVTIDDQLIMRFYIESWGRWTVVAGL